jgi:hypothetical protein
MLTSDASVAINAKALRARHRPDTIKVLFVGESAPASGKFFYAANSDAYRYLSEAIGPHLVGPAPFLDRFRDGGLYLDEVLTPVNHLAKRDRKARNANAAPALTARIAIYQPRVIVCIAKTIRRPVTQAHVMSGVCCPVHIVSFPGNGRQANFRRELGALLPGLLAIAGA